MRSQDRLHGEVNLAPPTSWQVIGLGIAALFMSAVGFLSFATYARVAQAQGLVESDRGVLKAAPSLPGVVRAVMVREGQTVRRGQPLFVVSHRVRSGDISLDEERTEALADEARANDARTRAQRDAATARVSSLEAEITRAEGERIASDAQIEQQQSLVTSGQEDLARIAEVFKRGFISNRDVRQREEQLAVRRQELSRLRQARLAAMTAIAGARARIAEVRAEMAAADGTAGETRARLRSRGAEVANVGSTTVVAEADGVVAQLVAVPGSRLEASEAGATIIPSGGKLRVRFRMPANAVAMVAPGQEATIALDAFPYQTYGTLPARVDRITESAIGDGNQRSFVAVLSLKRQSVEAYGQSRSVRPGMVATARIRTMERTLGQWLLDPLYAVGRR
jgi:membrane fusion protein